MIFYYLDSSSWVKYYSDEKGSKWIGNLLQTYQAFASSPLGFIEVLTILARKFKNREANPQLETKMRYLDEDWLSFLHIPLNEPVVNIVREIVKKKTLKGADTIHLASALLLKRKLEEKADKLIFISSDKKLNEAAKKYDLDVINPEEQ